MSIRHSSKIWGINENLLMHYCLGCKQRHAININKPNANNGQWQFNGNYEKSTFQPSIHITIDEPTCTDDELDILESRIANGENIVIPKVRKTICHYFIRDGKIEYLGDCNHSLAGQTIELPDIPDYCNY